MRKHVFAGSFLAAFTLATPALANTPDKAPPHQKWSFEGATGTYDKASLQRGFLVYDHVCASCHGMRSLTYRDLEGIGLSDQAITDLAHSKQIPGPVGISGMPTMRPGLPMITSAPPSPMMPLRLLLWVGLRRQINLAWRLCIPVAQIGFTPF